MDTWQQLPKCLTELSSTRRPDNTDQISNLWGLVALAPESY
jgi:hypothetical protein